MVDFVPHRGAARYAPEGSETGREDRVGEPRLVQVIEETPVVLIASVSRDDGWRLERALKSEGWTLLRVDDAEEAAQQLDRGDGRGGVLLIDAGLLEMTHDAQWRLLRARRPDLGTVVRCLISGSGPLACRDGRTFQVDPDDVEAMCHAVRHLCRPALAG